MSGVMTKVAIYGFVRIAFDLLGPPAWWWALPPIVLGAVTAVLGLLYAVLDRDLKRVLAYSTIENVGVIFVALGLALAFRANGQHEARGRGDGGGAPACRSTIPGSSRCCSSAPAPCCTPPGGAISMGWAA